MTASDSTSDPLAEIPAATLVVFRHGRASAHPEILMVVRSKAMSFAGGAAVFPGGRVDEADRDLGRSLSGNDLDVDEVSHRIAAIRETLEETGLAIGFNETIDADEAAAARAVLMESGRLSTVLDRYGWTLALDKLIPFARWLPRGITAHRIFDTRFYLADTGTGEVDIRVDATENSRVFWTSAENALARAETGELSLIFPTRRNLERLAQFDSFAAAKAQAERIPVRTITPATREADGTMILTIPDDCGYPVTSESFDTLQRG